MNTRVPFWSSLRLRVVLGIAIPLFIILGLAAQLQSMRQRDLVLANMQEFSTSVGESVETALTRAMLSRDRDQLKQVARDLGERSSIRNALILDHKGIVRIATKPAELDTVIPITDRACATCHASTDQPSNRSFTLTLADGSRVFRTITPILNRAACQTCHGTTATINGVLVLDLALGPIEANLQADFLQSLIWSGAAIVVVGLIILVLLDRIVMTRLERFRRALSSYARGDFAARVPVAGNDEIGTLANTVNGMAEGLEEKAKLEQENARLYTEMELRVAELSHQVQHLAVLEERDRLAREMHDGFAQALALLHLKLGAATGAGLKNGGGDKALQEIREIVDQTFEDVRQAIGDLRTPLPTQANFVTSLADYVQTFALRYNLHAQVITEPTALGARCTPDVEIQVMRIVQETMANVRKHASAQHVRVEFARQNGTLQVRMHDDGQGFDSAATARTTGHFGLTIMRERTASFGGALYINSAPGAGTTIDLCVPVTNNPEQVN